MSKPGVGCCIECPSDRDTTVLRVSSILIDYAFTLIIPGDLVEAKFEKAHWKVYTVGIPPFVEGDFVWRIHLVPTGQPYFEVKIRPLNRTLLVSVS